MSQLILDNQLTVQTVLQPIQKWIKVQRLQDLRPQELLLDERIPEVLLSLKRPTFITIDQDFWDRRWCHSKYCILYFALRDDHKTFFPICYAPYCVLRSFAPVRGGWVKSPASARPQSAIGYSHPSNCGRSLGRGSQRRNADAHAGGSNLRRDELPLVSFALKY